MALGDYVWYDDNLNGIQDNGELGVQGVTVNLYRDGDGDGIPETDGSDGPVIATDVTDSNGLYLFENLQPGNYFVEFVTSTLPSGYVLTSQDQGTNDAVDSDADPSTGLTEVIILGTVDDLTWDAGIFLPPPPVNPAIDIEKFVKVVEDQTGGGEGLTPGFWKTHSEFGPAPLKGWPDTGFSPLDSYNSVFGVSDDSGLTLLDALGRGGGGLNALGRHATAALLNAANPNVDYSYTQAEVIALTQAAYASGNASLIENTKNLFAVQNELGADLSTPADVPNTNPNDFGVDADTPPGPAAELGDTIVFTYFVTNPGDVELNSVVVSDDNATPGNPGDDFNPDPVKEDDGAGNDFNVGDDDQDGRLDPGETWLYQAQITALAIGQFTNIGTVVGTPVDENGDPVGPDVSDEDPANYVVGEPLASLGDYVWVDTNGNGLQDELNTGVDGVKVTLTGGGADGVIGTGGDDTTEVQITSGGGMYLFTNLNPGEQYKVTFSDLPSGYVFTSQDQGTNDELDSDADPITGMTIVTTLDPGEQDLSWDAGIVLPPPPPIGVIDVEKYVKVVEDQTGGGEGLTPGFWKQPHHFYAWTNYSPSDNYNSVFGINDDPNLTLLDALGRGGGENAALGRHAVAALLNASQANVEYEFTVAQIIAGVQNAYNTGDFEPFKNTLQDQNELGADLSSGGTGGGTPGPGADADTAPGLQVAIGDTLMFTYIVTNPGDVELANVSLLDDNGTPLDGSDDFAPTPTEASGFNVGDLDQDGRLDPGEEWVYTSMGIAGAGQHVCEATVTGTPVNADGDVLGNDVSDTDPAHFYTELAGSSIQGIVWADSNDNGEIDFGEQAIPGVAVRLTGVDADGQTVDRVAITDNDGVYFFGNLTSSNTAGYTLEESQPSGYDDGQDVVGTIDGIMTGLLDGNDVISGIVLQSGQDGINYNFGEIEIQNSGFLTEGQTATIGFWQNKNGQALLKSLNGGSEKTDLSQWLAESFPNLYGNKAGDHDLSGMTNAEVASFFKTIFKAKKQRGSTGPTKLDPQVLAVAFAVYVTNESLAGTAAQSYGFVTDSDGVGARLYDVDAAIGTGSSEQLFGSGVPSVLSVMEILTRVDNASTDGIVFDDGVGGIDSLEALRRSLANDLFTSINEAGDI
ncbi:SdrD B-like domain-containing protein [Stieleria sp.]|uniref:SdrD B-like domain-containing protein n=1 Tax=Stieleria sp. TaxID=2795976 RepID=UPI0035663739